MAVIGLVLIGAFLLLRDRIDVEAMHAFAQRRHGGVVFALLCVLPLVGFPVSLLHVAAGVRFGAGLGLVLVSTSIGFQLLVSYALVRLWPERFAARLGDLRQRIPPGAHASIAVFAVLLPGAPYVAINYLLPLLGVRLRTYLLCCWPLHTLRATVTVLLGDQAAHFTPLRLGMLGAYALALAAGSWWLYRRLRRELANPPAAAGDPRPHG